MDHFEEKSFWNIFNAPDPVVTLNSISNLMSTVASATAASTRNEMTSTEQYSPYFNDLLPPNALKMLPTPTQNVNHLSPADIKEGLWMDFMLVTALAFAAAVLIILIVVLAWAASGSSSFKYTFDVNTDNSRRNESNPMINEESV